MVNSSLDFFSLYIRSFLGAFGVVSLVREKQSGQLFAMKQVRKF